MFSYVSLLSLDQSHLSLSKLFFLVSHTNIYIEVDTYNYSIVY